MKRYFLRAITITLVAFLLGAGSYYLTGLEAVLGLDTLFKLRGVRPPPNEVVVAAMDETSEARLGVGQDLTRWRGFHARLIQELQRQGAALIVFDLQFIAPHLGQDQALASAIQAAGNVLITDCLQKISGKDKEFSGREECSESNKQSPAEEERGQVQQPADPGLLVLRKIQPTAILAKSALDHAPFFLPNDAGNPTIREVWPFLDMFDETPALPVVTWLYYLQRSGALHGVIQPSHPFSAWLTEQRWQCHSGTHETSLSLPEQSGLENRIYQVICHQDSQYLDYYGPPLTLRIESYSDVYEGKVAELKGKVIFVGKSNRKFSPGKTDYFHTPFTNTNSGRMAGVEIMATQFANLLEGRFLHSPFPPVLTLLLYGLVIAALLIRFAGFPGIAASALVSVAYAGFALWRFKLDAAWLPLAVPLLIQLPVSWLMALLWSRRDLLNERKRILAFVRRVFPQWLPSFPSTPGQWEPEISEAQLTFERDVSGLCLATDIEGYTAVAAHRTPHQMWELLSAYYRVLGQPVSSHNGFIADVTGDAMMAVWIGPDVNKQRLSACLAALEMELAVEQFNETSIGGRLPTRIGLHEGEMTLGRLDAGEGSHYRAIGDTVNTASRIQGVNKILGTQVLASAAIATGLSNVIYRPVGIFRLLGREEPLELMEIIGMETDVNASNYAVYKQFARGLSAFQQGQWENAIASFQTLLDNHGHDGPTRFYLALAQAYRENPPLAWEGVVTLATK